MRIHRFSGVDSTPSGDGVSCAKTVGKSRRGIRPDRGFTLVELLIVVTILPMIVGAITAGLLSVFSLQSSVANRLADSGDAQVVSANFVKDVQSAMQMTTGPTFSCGSGTQLLGLEWNNFQTIVSYAEVQNGTTYSLVRNYCTTGAASSPTSAFTISYDLPSAQADPSVTCEVTVNNCAAVNSTWISAQGVTGVKFAITQPKSNYSYALTAVPAAHAGSSVLGSPTFLNTSTTCGFASPGTGTYASTLCFVDFSFLNSGANLTAATNGGLSVTVAVPGGYTMSFILTLTGGYAQSSPFPTWSGAFFGNSNFYTGVGCLNGDSPISPATSCTGPAIYQPAGNNGETPTVVSISNISVLAPNQSAATGWHAVGLDAETTDGGESITFSSDQNLNLVPNTPSSPVGNACNATPGTISGPTLTGLGTTTVKCSVPSGVANTQKTGTLMVDSLTPTNLVTTLNGGASGLEGMSFGLLLP